MAGILDQYTVEQIAKMSPAEAERLYFQAMEERRRQQMEDQRKAEEEAKGSTGKDLMNTGAGLAGTIGGLYAADAILSPSTAAATQAATTAATGGGSGIGGLAGASTNFGGLAGSAPGAPSLISATPIGSAPAAPIGVSAKGVGAASGATSGGAGLASSIGSVAIPAAAIAALAYGANASMEKNKRTKARDQVADAFKQKGYSKDSLNYETILNSPEFKAAAEAEGNNPLDFSGLKFAQKAFEADKQRKAAGLDAKYVRKGGWGQKTENEFQPVFVDNSHMYDGMVMPKNVNPLYGGDMKNIDSGNFQFDIGRSTVSIPSDSLKTKPKNLPLEVSGKKAKDIIAALQGLKAG